MRAKDEQPQNETEKFIEKVLARKGINRNDIRFRQRDGNYHLVIGNWKRLSIDTWLALKPIVKLQELDIDDLSDQWGGDIV